MLTPVGVAPGGPAPRARRAPRTRKTPDAWVASCYYLAARLRADLLIPAGPSGYVPAQADLDTLAAMAGTAAPDLGLAARLAGEPPPSWPSGNSGVLGHVSIPAAFLLADPEDRGDFPPHGLRLRDHPITGEPLFRHVDIDPSGRLAAVPRGPRDDVLDVLDKATAGVRDDLAAEVHRTTRSLLFDRALLDPKIPPDPALLAAYRIALADAPALDPEPPWRRAVERAWPAALGLPLTVAGIVARFRAEGEALGVSKSDLAAGCRTLRSRPLRPNDHGAVARWVAGLDGLADPATWTRYARLGWGRARQASVAAQDRARRKGCGRQTHGSEGGQRQRCATHGCGHADCAPRQAALAGEQSSLHAHAWEDAGVAHVRIGLTLPRRGGWTPVEGLDALDPCAARFVRVLARSLSCKLAARIAVERQTDGTPEWVLILADVDGELTRRMLAEDAAYMACNQYDPPPMTPDLLAARTRVVTNAGIRTADLWPDLTREVQAAADTAAAKAGIAWEATYIAPVFDLDGTWGDVHKAAQATGHDWPEGFRRFRSSRGTKDGLVLLYAAAWTAAGSAPSNRQEGQEQRRAAEDRADASEAARTLSEAPRIPRGQGAARNAADAARTVANEAAAEADRSAAAAAAADEAANNADAWANEYADRAEAAARTYVAAKATLARVRKVAARAERRAVRARAHVATLVREHAIERAEVRAAVAEAEAEAHARAVEEADLFALRARRRAEDSAKLASAAAAEADRAAHKAREADIAAQVDELDQEKAERRARRMRQIASEAPVRGAFVARRARSEALLDGPLPLGRLARVTHRWSPLRPPPMPRWSEGPPARAWTVTDTVQLLRKLGPPGMKILGRIGNDGEIAAYRIVLPPPPSSEEPAPEPEPSRVGVTENPGERLDCVRRRLLHDRRLDPARPLGLPRDLALHADPAWSALPTDRELTDDDIDEVLRRYVAAGIRRATTTTRALCSGGLPVADAETWCAAGASRVAPSADHPPLDADASGPGWWRRGTLWCIDFSRAVPRDLSCHVEGA